MFLHYLRKVHRKLETEHSVCKTLFLIHYRKCPRNTHSHQYWCYKKSNLCSYQPWLTTMAAPDCMPLGTHDGKLNVCQILRIILQDGKELICEKTQSKD